MLPKVMPFGSKEACGQPEESKNLCAPVLLPYFVSS